MEHSPQEDDIWSSRNIKETQAFYARWAARYDRDMSDWKFALPGRIAIALRQAGANVEKGVLDFGCGTGLCGMALRAVGFQVIDGTDISPEMLAEAEARGPYRQVWRSTAGTLGHIRAGDYPAITASDVIGPGAAPPDILDLLTNALAPGNTLAFSFNDRALKDRRYTDRLDAIMLRRDIEMAFEANGPYLPAKDMTATVYVLRHL